VAEGVVVGLEAVEVEAHEQPRAGRLGGAQPGAELLGQLAPVAQAGQRIAERLLAQGVVADDVGGGRPPLRDQLGQQADLVVLERASRSRDAHGALERAPALDGERKRERPPRANADLLRVVRGHRGAAGGVQGVVELCHRAVGQPPRLVAAHRQPPDVGVERLDRPANQDVHERVEVEPRGERVAHAADRRLQARALADGKRQSLLPLLDPPVAVARHDHQQAGQRQHRERRDEMVAGGEGGERSHGRQGRVHDPDERDDLDLKARGDPAA
jgi:hypothetical protein